MILLRKSCLRFVVKTNLYIIGFDKSSEILVMKKMNNLPNLNF